MLGRLTILAVLSLLATVSILAQQQLVDPDFRAAVEKPAYPRGGPTVAIDEAHDNFHTAGGQYAPFAALLTSDGYHVVPSVRAFEPDMLRGVRVLVIANPRNMAALRAGDITKPGFTQRECDVVRDWVRAGGALLLIADHAPYGQATANLAARFGVSMGKGWVFDRPGGGEVTTQLLFSRDNGLLGTHRILDGRNPGEAVRAVHAFTGQSLTVPSGAAILLKFSATAREAATPDDLNAEDAAVRNAGAPGAHSSAVEGRAQGIALPFGKGRLVVVGEAGLFSAQIIRTPEGDRARDMKIGMNVPGNDNRQFALNVLHWLSGLLN